MIETRGTGRTRAAAPADVDVEQAIAAIEKAGGLVTPKEIAAEWGVSEPAIGERIRRGTFPEPVKKAGRVRLYLRSQVEPYRR